MKTTGRILVAMGGVLAAAAAPVAAQRPPASFTATPLIEVEARGIRTTDLEIPFCGSSCRDLEPHFLSYRVAIMTDGMVAGTLTATALDARAPRPAAVVFRAAATPEQLSTLRALLIEARIGIQPGGCAAGFSETVAGRPYPTRHGYGLSYSVLWYGNGPRLNWFELPQGASPCDRTVRALMQHLIRIARAAAAAARPNS